MFKFRWVLCVLAVFFSDCGFSAVGSTGRNFIISSNILPATPPPPPAGTSATGVPDNGVDEAQIIEQLKQQLILDYLKSSLGARFNDFAPKVTAEFADQFIIDYNVARKTGPTGQFLELSGHWDMEALNGWVRVNETKTKGSTGLRPMLVISSELPGLLLSPGSTAKTTQSTRLGQLLMAELGKVFKKFNTDLGLAPDRVLSVQSPSDASGQISELREYGRPQGYNSAVWVHLQPCRGGNCNTRVEIQTYNLNQGRRLFVHSTSLKSTAAELTEGHKLHEQLEPLLKEYSAKFEESVSKGALFSNAFSVSVKNIPSYKLYKKIKSWIGHQDFIVQAVPKKISPTEGEFAVLSNLSVSEAAQRLQSAGGLGIPYTVASDSSRIEIKLTIQ